MVSVPEVFLAFVAVPHAAKSTTISNPPDICIWIRALALDTMLVAALKDLVDPGASSRLLTSIGAAPSLQDFLREVQPDTLKLANIVDLRTDSPSPHPLHQSF